METVDATRVPFEVDAYGTAPDNAHPPLVQGDSRTVSAKLAECDRHLSAMSLEAVALGEELARLRAEAGERAALLAEREVVIAELSGLLPTLDEARIQALRRAEATSAALVEAEARLSEQGARAAELHERLGDAGTTNDSLERHAAELNLELAEERAKRDAAERSLAEAAARAHAAEHELTGAHEQLQRLSAERDRILLEQEEERVRARGHVDETEAARRVAEARLADQTTRVEALERELGTIGDGLAAHAARLAELEAELSRRARSAAEKQTDAVDLYRFPAEPGGSSHLRFVFRDGGYEVKECGGPPPEPGEDVEVEGARYSTTKIGRSPFPGDARLCAYLLADPD